MSWIRKWKTNKKKYSWKKVDRACDIIAGKVFDYEPDVIVALARGGLVPATILANKLNVRHVFSIGLASYNPIYGNMEVPGAVETYQKPDIQKLIRNSHAILIVDDISDRGTTFKHVENMFREQTKYNQIQTASLIIKPGTEFVPNYHYESVPDSTWVVFPWEN